MTLRLLGQEDPQDDIDNLLGGEQAEDKEGPANAFRTDSVELGEPAAKPLQSSCSEMISSAAL
jgi:hypothetical protein